MILSRTPVPADGTVDVVTGPAGAGPAATVSTGTHTRTYVILAGVALGLAALSLLMPSTPSYDPWCWLVWGRELFHGSLHLQGGASWKPLPVLFTTVFAAFGSAQPFLWLIIARAGFILTVLMAGWLAARIVTELGGRVRERSATAPTPGAGPPAGRRAIEAGPAALAAVIAAACVAITGGGWISDSALGYSEALATAFLVIGLERHVDGHHRQAFVCGLVAALDRPEIWAFWGPYGLWLMWRDPGARRLVIGVAVLTLALWFVPQKLGGGSFDAGIVRATHVRADSPALTACPFCTELKDAATLTLTRIKAAAGFTILLALAVPLLNRRRVRRGREPIELGRTRRRALNLGAILAVFGGAWWLLVAVETQAGFSGNPRYLTFGTAAVDIAAGVAFGAVALAMAELPARFIPAERRRVGPLTARALATTALGLVFLAIPGWVGGHLVSIRSLHRALDYQAALRTEAAAFIAEHGGPRGLQRCGAGHIMVENFQVPMIAWYMGERTIDIEAPPNVNAQGISLPLNYPWPNTIFQVAALPGATPLPLAATIHGWQVQGAHYRPTTRQGLVVLQDCGFQPDDQPAPTAS